MDSKSSTAQFFNRLPTLVDHSIAALLGLWAAILGLLPPGAERWLNTRLRLILEAIDNLSMANSSKEFVAILILSANNITGFVHVLGWFGLVLRSKNTKEAPSVTKTEKRKRSDLDLSDLEEKELQAEEKKWRPDGAYIAIHDFIRKMFGIPDQNQNIQIIEDCSDDEATQGLMSERWKASPSLRIHRDSEDRVEASNRQMGRIPAKVRDGTDQYDHFRSPIVTVQQATDVTQEELEAGNSLYEDSPCRYPVQSKIQLFLAAIEAAATPSASTGELHPVAPRSRGGSFSARDGDTKWPNSSSPAVRATGTALESVENQGPTACTREADVDLDQGNRSAAAEAKHDADKAVADAAGQDPKTADGKGTGAAEREASVMTEEDADDTERANEVGAVRELTSVEEGAVIAVQETARASGSEAEGAAVPEPDHFAIQEAAVASARQVIEMAAVQETVAAAGAVAFREAEEVPIRELVHSTEMPLDTVTVSRDMEKSIDRETDADMEAAAAMETAATRELAAASLNSAATRETTAVIESVDAMETRYIAAARETAAAAVAEVLTAAVGEKAATKEKIAGAVEGQGSPAVADKTPATSEKEASAAAEEEKVSAAAGGEKARAADRNQSTATVAEIVRVKSDTINTAENDAAAATPITETTDDVEHDGTDDAVGEDEPAATSAGVEAAGGDEQAADAAAVSSGAAGGGRGRGRPWGRGSSGKKRRGKARGIF